MPINNGRPRNPDFPHTAGAHTTRAHCPSWVGRQLAQTPRARQVPTPARGSQKAHMRAQPRTKGRQGGKLGCRGNPGCRHGGPRGCCHLPATAQKTLFNTALGVLKWHYYRGPLPLAGSRLRMSSNSNSGGEGRMAHERFNYISSSGNCPASLRT